VDTPRWIPARGPANPATKYGLILIKWMRFKPVLPERVECFLRELDVGPGHHDDIQDVGGSLPLAGLLIREEFDTWPSGSTWHIQGNLLSSRPTGHHKLPGEKRTGHEGPELGKRLWIAEDNGREESLDR